jgi:hypothetical protein
VTSSLDHAYVGSASSGPTERTSTEVVEGGPHSTLPRVRNGLRALPPGTEPPRPPLGNRGLRTGASARRVPPGVSAFSQPYGVVGTAVLEMPVLTLPALSTAHTRMP